MKKLRVPSIYDFRSCHEFLAAFYRENKDSDPRFSYRLMARRLKWPQSLLSDIIAGRKNLTVRRAIEFCEWIQFDPGSARFFVLLVLKGDSNKAVSDFFNELLEQDSTKPGAG